jgi:hypothetical protein
MTTTSSLTPTSVAAVGVAVCGSAAATLGLLSDRLAALPGTGVRWDVWRDDDVPEAGAVDVAVCPDPESVRQALLRWPGAAAVMLAGASEDADAAAGLATGATVCVRGGDVALVAAFVRSVARRRGLLPVGLGR